MLRSINFRYGALGIFSASLMLPVVSLQAAQTSLADAPIANTQGRLANIAITASVEFPTAISVAHKDPTFVPTNFYSGYFDPDKCYTYDATNKYFVPVAMASGTNRTCSNRWSGNLLNFATMQTADIFRWALTGGSRQIDLPVDSSDSSASKTVLRRTYNAAIGATGNNPNFPVRFLENAKAPISSYVNTSDLGVVAGATIIGFNSAHQGLNFQIAKYTSTTDNRPDTFFNISSANKVAFRAAVEVCKFNAALGASNGLEGGCVTYTDANGVKAYKPEGLMQKYKTDFRFSVFGYLNRQYESGGSGPYKDGGVMRAPMKFVDYELSDMGAYKVNPDPALATASGVSKSGAMNYINNFGFDSLSYKYNDPVSELYAEAVRYFSDATAASPSVLISSPTINELDYHPAVSNWTQYPAIKYSCDKNFIIGIGDVNTHADAHITTAQNPGGLEPSSSPINMGFDAKVWTAKVGAADSRPNLDTTFNLNGDGTGLDLSNNSTGNQGSCCNYNSYYIAGLAFYANTNDLVPTRLTGTQTVQTYWIDIFEYQKYKHRNQYWLAAKFGGFKDNSSAKDSPNKSGDVPDVDTEWWSNCRTVTNATGSQCATNTSSTSNQASKYFPIPDNYFPAANANALVDGLVAAFNKIKSETAVGAGIAAGSNVFSANSTLDVYQTSYSTEKWFGDVQQRRVTGTGFNTSGQLVATPIWSASTVLTGQFAGTGWNTNRRVVTMARNANTCTATPQPFRTANLTATQLATLGSTAADQLAVLNYLRGDASKEGTTFRVRADDSGIRQPLGDIVNSGVLVVGKPDEKYTDDFNPGYGAFKAAKASRPERLYVGANDGMLHALDSSTGNETWAYVPSVILEGESLEAAGLPESDGMATLANKTYSHRFYVNATPVARDIDFNRAADEDWKTATTSDWRTILVGGLGKGGKMFYAIDITDPTTLSDSETTVAGKVLWEFTPDCDPDPDGTGPGVGGDLGYSFGEPLVIKTERWGWVVVFASGYNNATGKAAIYIVNPKTGALIQRVYATAATATIGTPVNPAGLAELTGFTASYSNWIYNEIYGGDLFGNVWRWDLPPNKAINPTKTSVDVVHLAALTDGTNPQPVTMPPWVDLARDGKRYVFVGTGRSLDIGDVTGNTGSNPQTQTVYAIRDGDLKAPYIAATLPAGKTYPIHRSDLDVVSTTLTGRTLTTGLGWYYDLARLPPTGVGTERMVKRFKRVAPGVIAWIGDLPSDDPCSPGFSSAVYAVNMGTGQSVLKDSSGAVSAFVNAGVNLSEINAARVGQGISIIGTDSTGKTTETAKIAGGDTPRVVNWRAIGD